jgi:predicted transcriptional regulator of viral defense system
MGNQRAKVRLSEVARRQWGRVAWAQIVGLGVDKWTINDWRSQGYLHRVHPRVYAVGHDAPSIEGDLAAALLYAGPGAMLSHATAMWWWGLRDDPPPIIHVSTPRRCRSRPGVQVHQRRSCARTWHKHMPVTTVAQTLFDHAAESSWRAVRKALAKAEYQRLLSFPELEALIGRGRSGSVRLREALDRHQPRLALTRSGLEETLFELCESSAIALPEVNATIEGWTVDFLWRNEGVVVEVDGYGNHHTPAQVDRDRRKDLALRASGLVVNRYSRQQIELGRELVGTDLKATLARRRR